MAPESIWQDVSLLRMEYALTLDAVKVARDRAQAARERVETALQVQFQARVRDQIDRTGSFSLTDAIQGGVPCSDCLGVVTTKSRPVHVFSLSSGDDGGTWKADARCGHRIEGNVIEVKDAPDSGPGTIWR